MSDICETCYEATKAVLRERPEYLGEDVARQLLAQALEGGDLEAILIAQPCLACGGGAPSEARRLTGLCASCLRRAS